MSNRDSAFKRWIRFSELSTKVISLTPFLLGVAYSLYRSGALDVGLTILLYAAVLLWDVTVTMINNFIDKRREGGTPHFSTGVSLAFIFGMGGVSILLGIWLTLLCGLPVLVVGVICFGIGILYSFGPISISRTPYGEIASGLTMGFFIFFLTVYVNAPARETQYLAIRFDGALLSVTMHWANLLYLVLLSLPIVFCTANIMLANNICDVERDAKNARFTLPYYIGRKHALQLFQALFAAAYVSIIAAVILGILHPLSLAAVLTAPLVYQNAKRFTASPVKAETFILSVQNYLLLLFGLLVTLLAAWLLFGVS